MPDIAMCNGNNCPLKETCHRFTATPSALWQSYFSQSPMERRGECSWYWDNKDYPNEQNKSK